MKNKVIEIDENTVGIVIDSPKHGEKICIIDREDLGRVSAFENWCAWGHEGYTSYAMSKIGYAYTGFQSNVLIHRLVMSFPLSQIDHINGNGMDNRKTNLRCATNSENMRNRKRTIGSSAYRGVCRRKGAISNPWVAYARENSRLKYLGVYPDEKSAAKVYNEYIRNNYGDFASLNPID